jgi:hypothetical protein
MITFRVALGAAVVALAFASTGLSTSAWAQDVAAVTDDAATDDAAASGLSEEDLNVLVARIALYPDDLVALIAAASIYPLQIVEAERYLETAADKPDEQPKESWDPSVISLLNYPEVVKMMSDDLEWTQDLGTALAYQQQDVLVAIQQLRDQAVAKGAIRTDDKVTVTNEGDNVIIQPTSQEVVYVPQYEPEMLYEPDYEIVPISYYPDPYPYYYSPAAPYFAGFVTGAVWGAMVDWNDWGVWGGDWGDHIDVNCNNCFNNITGRVRASDIDWRDVDRSKVSFDRTQFDGNKRDSIRTDIKRDQSNSVRTRAATVKREHAAVERRAPKVTDIRTSAHTKRPEGRERPAVAGGGDRKRPDVAGGDRKRPDVAGGGERKRQTASGGGAKKPEVKRHASKPKPAARGDSRPKKPAALGEVRSGKKAQVHSTKGRQAMGGGGRPHKSVGGGGRRGGGGGRHR